MGNCINDIMRDSLIVIAHRDLKCFCTSVQYLNINGREILSKKLIWVIENEVQFVFALNCLNGLRVGYGDSSSEPWRLK